MVNNKQLKLIVFDIGGTVFSKGKQAFIDLLAKRLNVSREKVVSVVDGPHALAYRRNEISAEAYWRIVKEHLNVPADFGNLEKLWFDQYVPLPEMPEIVARLRQRYRVAYLSNNTPERVAYINQKYQFLDWFDGGIFSYEVGSVKADGGLYEALLKRFNTIMPSETLLIDDLEKNLVGPSKAGFQTLAFQNPRQLIEELQKKGVLTSL